MNQINHVPFVFVIDTDKYTGGTENNMCKYITGNPAEYDSYEEDEDGNECMFPDVQYITGEYGEECCAIWQTPGWFNDGMGNHYKIGEDPDFLLRRYKESVIKSLDITNWKIRYESYIGENGWTRENVDKEIERIQDRINAANALTEVGKYPAYNSVGIYFSSKPHKKQIAVIKERAAEYASNHNMTITGYRLITRILKETEKSV